MLHRQPSPITLAAPPEFPLAGLGAVELLLVTLWRLHAAVGQGRLAARWRVGLAVAGLGAAERDCKTLFRLLAENAPPRPPRCATLAQGEGRLLLMVGLLQQGRQDVACCLLETDLPASLAQQAIAAAGALASALAARQLAIPVREAWLGWRLCDAGPAVAQGLLH